MATAYWYGDYSDLNSKNTTDGFNSDGVHNSCLEYDSGVHRHAPVASLGLGAPTKAILKCDQSIDLSIHYPSFVRKTLSEIRDILNVEANHFYDPALDS